MKIDLERDNLVTLMKKLEDLEYESSIVNRQTLGELEKSLSSTNSLMEKGIIRIMINTFKAVKSGSITVNGSNISPYEKEIDSESSVFDSVNYDVYSPKTVNNLVNFFLDTVDLDVGRVNESMGARFYNSKYPDSESFDFNRDTGLLVVGLDESRKYFFKEDFDSVAYKADEGIYLLKKSKDGLYSGVDMIREINNAL